MRVTQNELFGAKYGVQAKNYGLGGTRIARQKEKSEYPQYDFEKHKGYGTKLHYEKLREFGPSPIHRMSFLKKMH